jgi:hypothetical protein
MPTANKVNDLLLRYAIESLELALGIPTPSPAKPQAPSETVQEQAESPLGPIRAVRSTPADVG